MTNVAQLSVFNGNSTFHSGINNADDLAFLGIHDLHEAYRWYNDHVAFVPHNAIRVLRVAQSVWTFTMTWCRNAHVAVRQDGMSRMPMNWKYSAMNSRTGRMKLLPNLRKSPVTTNAYARFLRHLATGATVNAIDRAASSIPFRVTD